MRKLALITVAVALASVAGAPVLAQSSSQAPRRDGGGLHVSGGGVVGYVGGSGSISGNVTGPGGSRPRARSTAVSPASEPNASKDGVVTPARITVEKAPRSKPVKASNATPLPLVIVLGSLAVAAFVLLGRRRRAIPDLPV
jgi:hypothetical protein